LEKKIERLKKEIQTERIVSERIKNWHNKKAGELQEEQDDREKIKNDGVDAIKKEVQEILEQKQEDEEEIARMEEDIKEEQKMQEQKEQEEAERQRMAVQKAKEMKEMDEATGYLQWKWKWFNEEGRKWVKKKKKKKGKKKK